MDWIKTSERLPSKEDSDQDGYVDCFVYGKGLGVMFRPFNIHHQCWDDEDRDDHWGDPERVSHWQINKIPKPPE